MPKPICVLVYQIRATYFIREHSSLSTFAPQVSEPVQTCKLEGLQLATGFEVVRVLGNLVVHWPGVDGIRDGAGRHSRASHTGLVVGNGILGLVFDLIVGFPSALGVVEISSQLDILQLTCPLAQEERYPFSILDFVLFSNHSLHNLVALMQVLYALSINLVLFQILPSGFPLCVRLGVAVCLLHSPHFLYVVFNLFEAGVRWDV